LNDERYTMKTDALIDMLASDAGPVDPRAASRRVVVSVAAAAVVCLMLLIAWLGPRADLGEAVSSLAFWWKQIFTLSLVLAGFIATVRLARPGVPLGRTAAWMMLVPLLAIWIVSAYILFSGEPAFREQVFSAENWVYCTRYIATLSVPVFIVTLWSLRGLAPTQLRMAGAAAGLLSGAVAAAVYCLHCPEVQPPFVAVWYVLGIFTPVAVGALIAPRVLRW
jgi:hypothetical protein